MLSEGKARFTRVQVSIGWRMWRSANLWLERRVDEMVARGSEGFEVAEENRRRALVAMALIFAVLELIGWAIVVAFDMALHPLVLPSAITVNLATPFLARSRVPLRFTETLFHCTTASLMVYYIYATGGASSFVMVWVPVYPVVVLSTSGLRSALGMTCFFFAAVLYMLYLDDIGALPVSLLEDEAAFGVMGINLLNVLAASLMVAAIREQELRRQVHQRVEEASGRRSAEMASETKSRLMASISHEIRTPMSGILGTLELMERSSLNDQQREWLSVVQDSGSSLLMLLDDLLDSVRLERDQISIVEQPFDPASLVNRVVGLFKPEARRKGITVQRAAMDHLPERLLGDPGRLRQVLTNLLGNAIKFTDEGSVWVGLHWHAGTFSLWVRDTGAGIAPERLENIFDPFVQGDQSNSRKHGGTGLGLYISRQLVRRMGGMIRVRSVVGWGSTFEVSLPLAEWGESPEPALEGDDPSVVPLRVLLVDDNQVNLMVTRAMLESLGHEVEVADGGKAALRALRAQLPDVMLLDLQMPDMDGFQVMASFATFPGRHAVRVIALTANATAEDRDACLSAGMDDFLTKPVGLERLGRALHLTAPDVVSA